MTTKAERERARESALFSWRARVRRAASVLDLDVTAAAPGAPVLVRIDDLEALAERLATKKETATP